MKVLRFEVCIAPEHFPIFVPRYQRDLLDGDTSFKQSARSFVPEIVEVQVGDLQVHALAPKSRTR